jgi:hypothetical protein
VSTYGIIFLGTPHQGGNGVQLGKLLVNIASEFVAADDGLLKHLERDSEWLQQQLGQYGPISGDFVTKFAFEEYKTRTAFGSIMVCDLAFVVQAKQKLIDAGGTARISRRTGPGRRRADRGPRRPYQHGQVQGKRNEWI